VIGSILVVDDEPRVGRQLQQALASDGHQVEFTADPLHAVALMKERAFDVLVTDLKMPRLDGIELLRRTKQIRPACEVVLMTAFATVETAREALKLGAVDYLTKPFEPAAELLPLIRRLLDAAPAAEGEAPAAPAPLGSARLVGKSAALREVLQKLPRIAASEATVLILGESGTGKELVADALHRLSRRADGPFVKLNCAALPETLLESELFGHGRGAFTGAHRETEGVFQAAHGGTLFLDEIAELAPALQPKLLRVLETGEFHRLGDSRRTVRVDVRLIAATNRDLPAEIAAGRFRADLYYRLAVVPLSLPPLRERREDLPALIEHLVERHGGAGVHFTPEAMQALLDYGWPGNVRELSNAVESAIVLGDPGGIRLEHLPVAVQEASLRGQGLLPAPGGETLEDIEIHSIRQAMERAEGNRTRAAELLGVTRRTLGYRIQKYGLEFSGRTGEAPRGGAPRTPLRVSPKPMELDKRV